MKENGNNNMKYRIIILALKGLFVTNKVAEQKN